MSENVRKPESVIVEDAEDRRRFCRRFAETTFVAGTLSGRLVDVSESGLGLEAAEPFPVLQRGTFTLGIGRAKPRFSGQIRWCRLVGAAASSPGDAPPVYRAGVALFDS